MLSDGVLAWVCGLSDSMLSRKDVLTNCADRMVVCFQMCTVLRGRCCEGDYAVKAYVLSADVVSGEAVLRELVRCAVRLEFAVSQGRMHCQDCAKEAGRVDVSPRWSVLSGWGCGVTDCAVRVWLWSDRVCCQGGVVEWQSVLSGYGYGVTERAVRVGCEVTECAVRVGCEVTECVVTVGCEVAECALRVGLWSDRVCCQGGVVK